MDNYIVVGTIVGPHALKGEVKVVSDSDFKEERFKVGNKLFLNYNQEMIEVVIRSYRTHKNFDLLLFEGVTSINDIEKYNKCKLYIHEDQLEPLDDDDEFYYFELIGCTVLTNDDVHVGMVKNIHNYGASDILVVEDEKRKQTLIPFVDEFIESVDLETRTIIIDPIEGLLGDSDAN